MGKTSKRKRCPRCGSLDVLKWGICHSKQRFKCRECGDFINGKSVNPETGELTYTHARLRQAYVMLKKALPDMFKYIGHPEV